MPRTRSGRRDDTWAVLPRTVLLLCIVATLGTSPAAEAKTRVWHSHVPACVAKQGARCQALIRNWRPGVTRLVVLKEMR
jgi:hypothetical protein